MIVAVMINDRTVDYNASYKHNELTPNSTHYKSHLYKYGTTRIIYLVYTFILLFNER